MIESGCIAQGNAMGTNGLYGLRAGTGSSYRENNIVTGPGGGGAVTGGGTNLGGNLCNGALCP